jgi:hypothetical protein
MAGPPLVRKLEKFLGQYEKMASTKLDIFEHPGQAAAGSPLDSIAPARRADKNYFISMHYRL